MILAEPGPHGPRPSGHGPETAHSDAIPEPRKPLPNFITSLGKRTRYGPTGHYGSKLPIMTNMTKRRMLLLKPVYLLTHLT